MYERLPARTLRAMPDTHSAALDRLEARIDHQAARIDELFRLLREHGLIDEDPADVPLAREHLHVGQATGV
jgi:hypothetical protein